ncbi:porin family protein [Rufibacter latericius]|uniref:Outer membrane protein beta-barrel domain-containing protein n=1 Tax=Rufibacter latericius TaxID=2487040 RepID=A0A3M9MCZ5_9BACT|nr:outer membrane beta-barrel protein [Rufibacter latericius]RNI22703.1 hypothetical protein EFB08_21665 [Rufibacter latericius]
MNLNNISDEELDRLFKASADNFDPPFDPEAWEAMDRKLEQVHVRSKWLKGSTLLLCLILFIGFFTLYPFDEKPENDFVVVNKKEVGEQPNRENVLRGRNEKNRPKTEIAPSQAQNDAKENSSVISSASEEKANKDKSVAKAKVGDETNTIESSSSHLNRETREREVPKKVFILPKPNSGVLATKRRDKPSTVKDFSSSPEEIQGEGAFKEESKAAIVDNRTSVRNELSLLEYRGELRLEPMPGKVLEPVLVAVHEDKIVEHQINPEQGTFEKGNSAAFMRSIQLAVAVAPDVTTVKFRDPEALSMNAGLVVGLPLTNRLSLVTGVVWANKVYSARPQDYYFSNGYTYTSPVDATCKVLDIPINIQYKIVESGRNSFSVQAGLSSYIMLHEEYSSVASGYGSYPYHKEISYQNQHWFKVQNVSLVYTRAISPLFSLGMEPFVKIPYAGIGDGKVKLTSAGVFFTAGYTIKLKP